MSVLADPVLTSAKSAINTRILTLADLQEAQEDGDVTDFVDTGIYFNSPLLRVPPTRTPRR